MSELLIVPVTAALPRGFGAMQIEAREDGHRHLDRLAAEWEQRICRFDGPGECLLAAFKAGELAGIGGITIDPDDPAGLRMRRFYVRRAFRRLGVGGMLATRLMTDVPARVTVSVHAGDAMAALFWVALGFEPDERRGHTHVIQANTR